MRNVFLKTQRNLYWGLLILSAFAQAAAPAPGGMSLPQELGKIELRENICYARVDGEDLLLDLYRPTDVNEPLPLIVWIHGGGWRGGSKQRCPAAVLAQDGFAVASINYRLTGRAIFPAQIHDCKGAIRFLRSRAGEFGVDPKAVGAWGSSAGGTLAALVGTSGGVKDLEGEVGGNTKYSSEVQAVCDWFGRKEFLAFSDPNKLDPHQLKRLTAVESLFGGPLSQSKKLAEAASPATHIDKKDPPFLIMHGVRDTTVWPSESELFYKQLKSAGVPAELILLEGQGHGFRDPNQIEPVRNFFIKNLKK